MEEGNGIDSTAPETAPPSTPTLETITSVHVTALDAIVNVNTLFTVATFIGLSLPPPTTDPGLEGTNCLAQPNDVRRLHLYEFVSFSFFLFSSLIAQGLKLAINLLHSKVVEATSKAKINCKLLRFGILSSGIGSVMGCVFLMLAMILVVEVKLGTFGCGGYTMWVVFTLIVLVSSALLVYISNVFYAIVQF